ncbi:GNAT family N-acetyltransferase [Acaryochloris sp. CCMEE 5410]|uniref:GNAT family N-acetyltransferase n=1 Tax=Acaryochloris sp. CCMEE 5410 TaxID=310037 RepID=UPI0002484438|nr:GNAT family N-acetyltransferase [Acaryochloris sp. CCMEE 5410]KAI9131755.1 hypothetical protein ON05_029755 [Acaryochloris sp. CCMEE 5410]
MVRPADRGQGNGTQLLALTLAKAQKKGIQPVLITYHPANRASVKVIQKNGGALTSKSYVPRINQQWIELGTMP